MKVFRFLLKNVRRYDKIGAYSETVYRFCESFFNQAINSESSRKNKEKVLTH